MKKYVPAVKILIFSLCSMILFFSQSPARSNITPFTFKTLENEIVHIDSLLQKGPVLIVFWAMWCKPCKEELHALSKAASEYPFDSITIIPVNNDTPRSLNRVKSYVKAHQVPFICCTDPGREILRIFNATGIPFTAIIGENREVVLKHSGYVPGDLDEYKKRIEYYLKADGNE